MKNQTNRITRYYSHELEPVSPEELRAAIANRERQERMQWQLAYQRGTDDGYACGWVHAAVVFVGLTLAAAAWRVL